MEVKIAVGSVIYVLMAVGVSWWFWACLSGGEPSTSATIRNLVLIWGTPLAIFLAVWRSIVAQKQAKAAQKQAEIAQGGLLSNRYQRAVEMLGHERDSIRIGGIHVLRNLALEHYDEYQEEVLNLLRIYHLNLKHRRGAPLANQQVEERDALKAMEEIERRGRIIEGERDGWPNRRGADSE